MGIKRISVWPPKRNLFSILVLLFLPAPAFTHTAARLLSLAERFKTIFHRHCCELIKSMCIFVPEKQLRNGSKQGLLRAASLINNIVRTPTCIHTASEQSKSARGKGERLVFVAAAAASSVSSLSFGWDGSARIRKINSTMNIYLKMRRLSNFALCLVTTQTLALNNVLLIGRRQCAL
jgi:hypothetical protein